MNASQLPPLQPTSLTRVQPRWVVPLGVAAAAGAGLIVFVNLSARREAPTAQGPAAVFEPAPPPLEPMAPAAAPAQTPPDFGIPAPHLSGASETVRPMEPGDARSYSASSEQADRREQRWRSASLIVDLAGPSAPAASPAAGGMIANPALPVSAGAGEDRRGGDEAFARRLAAETTGEARSSRLADPARTAPQGTIVPAVLETAINSDLPGFARAVVSRDVRAFDGTTVVIPRGSKLVGQYRNGVAAGQSRAFVVWTRLLRPDGVTIDLASPAADALGRGGLQGKTDQHFFQRFGAAILLSVVSGATTRSTGDTVVIGSAQDASRIAEIALQKQIDIPPTIKVAQGAPIRVFVARDLVFESPAR